MPRAIIFNWPNESCFKAAIPHVCNDDGAVAIFYAGFCCCLHAFVNTKLQIECLWEMHAYALQEINNRQLKFCHWKECFAAADVWCAVNDGDDDARKQN